MPEGTEEYRTIELSFNSEEINKYEDESNESDDSSGSDKDDKEKKDRDDGDKGTSEDHKSKDDEDKEDNTEKRVKADLTQTEAINIIKKYEMINLKVKIILLSCNPTKVGVKIS